LKKYREILRQVRKISHALCLKMADGTGSQAKQAIFQFNLIGTSFVLEKG
jgi:hypothetical protein